MLPLVCTLAAFAAAPEVADTVALNRDWAETAFRAPAGAPGAGGRITVTVVQEAEAGETRLGRCAFGR